MFNRCMHYIDKNNILNEKQFGVRSKYSTHNGYYKTDKLLRLWNERRDFKKGVTFLFTH